MDYVKNVFVKEGRAADKLAPAGVPGGLRARRKEMEDAMDMGDPESADPAGAFKRGVGVVGNGKSGY